jgi:hypothetical protein
VVMIQEVQASSFKLRRRSYYQRGGSWGGRSLEVGLGNVTGTRGA